MLDNTHTHTHLAISAASRTSSSDIAGGTAMVVSSMVHDSSMTRFFFVGLTTSWAACRAASQVLK